MRIAAVLLALSLLLPLAAQETKTFEILTVGNSFSQNATRFLADLIRAGKVNARVERSGALGGHSMQRHLSYARAYEADPNDPAGHAYTLTVDGEKRKVALQDLLKMAKWNVVTIQQLSSDSFRPETFAAAGELVRIIKQYAPGAEVVFHETWSYRGDDPWLAKNDLTAETMYEQLHRCYYDRAAELGLRVIPTGTAFQRALASPEWGYAPPAVDRARLVYPELPDQQKSLHGGYRWQKDKQDPAKMVLGYDPRHANGNGEYLGAAVWYEFFFGNVERLNWVPRSLSPEAGAALRKIAAETVRDAKPAN